jgi:transglutaminase-like putative cysteine protease
MSDLAKSLAIMGLAWASSCEAKYEPPYTIVKDLVSVHVMADGSSTESTEYCIRIETQAGVNIMGEQRISYVSTLEDVAVTEAYTLQPDGSRVMVTEDRIRTVDESGGSGELIYSDAKVKVIIFPQVQVGSMLCYKANTKQHTPYFKSHYFYTRYFSPHGRYENFQLKLTHDPKIKLSIDADRVNGGLVKTPSKDGLVHYEFEYKQLEAYPSEPNQAEIYDYAPHIAITSFASYEQMAKAYYEVAEEKAKVTDGVRALAKEITKGAKDRKDKVRRLYNWVSVNIRYLGIYMGDGGYVPHDAQSILDNHYGDCKDHVVLLEALLKAVGIDSTPALINMGFAYKLPKLPTVTPFNHVITYVPEFDLYLDSTAQFAPMGVLPREDSAKPVILTSTGEIRYTPSTSPLKDWSETKVVMKLMSDGRIQGFSNIKTRGYYEVDSRMTRFYENGRDQERLVAKYLSRFMESGKGEIANQNALDLDSKWKDEAFFELNPVVNIPGPSAMAIPVGIAPGYLKMMTKAQAPKSRRFQAYCFSSKHVEDVELEFPDEVQITRIPKDVSFDNGLIRYSARYELVNKTLKVQRTYQAKSNSPICGAHEDVLWQQFHEVLTRDMRSQVFFD